MSLARARARAKARALHKCISTVSRLLVHHPVTAFRELCMDCQQCK